MAEGWQQPNEGAGQELYLCPICSTRVSSTATECPSCHAIFVEDGEGHDAAAPDAPKVEPVQYKCPSCDATVSETDPKCPSCGAVFIDAVPPPLPPPAPAPAPRPAAAAAKGPPAPAVPARPPAAPGPAPKGVVPRQATKRRQKPTPAAARVRKHSKAVAQLSARRKRIAQRTIIGLIAMAAGLGVYMVSLFMGGGGKFTLLTGLGMGLGIALFAVGVLIYSTQILAKQHYQSQLQNARAEAALLKELSKGRPSAGPSAARPAPPARGRPGAQARPWEEGAGSAVASLGAATGAAATAPATAEPAASAPAPALAASAAPSDAPASSITVEVAPAGPDEKDKVPCSNCGYMNRRIFVRCIRCGTELQKREPSIAVETFEKPGTRGEGSKEAIRGGAAVVPWEARRASVSQASKAASRAAERRTALAEAEAAAAAKGADRRAVIGVAANFQRLPREMRESLIRTLHRMDDPVVRQDVVSAIAENYTEVPRDIQELLGDLADDEDARVREEVAFEVNRNFDRIPLNVVQAVFAKLARDPERMVREDVVSAIAENFQRLPKESQDLLRLLAQDPVESVRDEVSFEVAKNSDVIPEKFKSEVMELIKRVGGG
jgi:hypothetical protein